jgi:hypothetical protein
MNLGCKMNDVLRLPTEGPTTRELNIVVASGENLHELHPIVEVDVRSGQCRSTIKINVGVVYLVEH